MDNKHQPWVVKPRWGFLRRAKPLSFSILGLCLLFILAGGLLASCADVDKDSRASAGKESRRVFRINLGTEPPDLDPARMTDLTSFSVIQPMMKGLTQFDQEMNVVPAIAERWVRSMDGLSYVFYLRKDAKWSDGEPVTALDFIYAWERALNPETAAEYGFFLFDIENARAYNNGGLSTFKQVGVWAPTLHKLVIRLERPVPFFPDLLASPIALPLRQDMIERHGDQFTEAGNFITNGAYRMDRWVHEEKITLSPNPHFYNPPPRVDAIEMYMVNDANTSVVMYENDELDFIETTTSIPAFDVRRLRESPDYRHLTMHRVNYVGYNTQKPPFDDPRVRRAFGLAIDRTYFPRLMQSGENPTASLISPGLLGHNPDIGLHFNPEKARALLAGAGYPDGQGFPPVTLAYRTMYDIQKQAEIIQFLWKKHLNVDVRLENMEWKVYLSRVRQDAPHMFKLGWFVDYPDPDSFMSLFTADSGNNHTNWQDERYDALVKKAMLTLDPGQRAALYDEAQTILLEEAAAIVPIFAAEKSYMVKPHVRGLKINPLNLANFDELEVLPRPR